jgi:hypothetical protein
MNKCIVLPLLLLFIAGCRVFDISEEQARQIAEMAGSAAAGITDVATGPISPGAGAGVGAMVGLAVAATVKVILGAMTKKKSV